MKNSEFLGYRSGSIWMLAGVCTVLLVSGCSDPFSHGGLPRSESVEVPTSPIEPVEVSAVESEKSEEPEVSEAEPAVESSPAVETPAEEVATPAETLLGVESGKPRIPQVLVPTREFSKEGAEKALRVTYDDLDLLKVLNMDPVTPKAKGMMPKWLKGLHGQTIRLRGFMYPPFQETDIPVFVLARDNQICCFGRNPKIYDLVTITMKSGVTADYIQNRPFDVVGKFRIEMVVEDDNEILDLYHLDDAIVIDR